MDAYHRRRTRTAVIADPYLRAMDDTLRRMRTGNAVFMKVAL